MPSYMPDCVGGGSIAKGIPDFLRPLAVNCWQPAKVGHYGSREIRCWIEVW